LKLEYHKLLSTIAFNFKLRRYSLGWYLNGCTCPERQEVRRNYEGDVRVLAELGFDGVKLDACSAQLNMARGVLRTGTRPTLNILLLLRASV